ncbi:hypothetical protein C8A05DRAFT_38990 [Staphylotrichum tortipilum]|uniref:Uncharacterized protein n=1 Tax=Staphylotrichum tortipilum TaxID=2831512 RepID=A0AAN6MCI3_9PEZI|nr:hypothetical protein C8A05DRAFT_38990 [Staphylotrichum longicolle]
MAPQDDNPQSTRSALADFNKTYNSISLGMAAHNTFLSNLSKHRAAKNTSTQPTRPAPQRTISSNSDLNTAWLPPPSAGLGYRAPPSSSKSPSASSSGASTPAPDHETNVLRKKILGRNAARQVAEGQLQQKQQGLKKGSSKGNAGQSESEEEVGRGGLVRTRGKRGATGEGREAEYGGRRKRVRVEGGEGKEEGKEEGKAGGDSVVVCGEDVVMGGHQGGEQQEGEQTPAESEKKRKRKNKKKKGTGGGEPGTVAVEEN